jgi:hypothetical protein
MHSSHYKSFTIHHNGDYSGDYIILNIRRDEFGNQLNPMDYVQIRTTEEELKHLLKQSLVLHNPKIEIVGLDDDTKEPISFDVNTDEVLSLFIEKMKFEMISDLENIKDEVFFKKYMTNTNW